MEDYNIHDAYAEGGFDFSGSLDNAARSLVGAHYMIASAIIILLVVVLLWMYFKKESFNPTQSLRFSDSDQYALGKKDRFDGGDPAAPESDLSKSLGCRTMKPVGDDAWSWMFAQVGTPDAPENFTPKNPKTDGDFSKILAGL